MRSYTYVHAYEHEYVCPLEHLFVKYTPLKSCSQERGEREEGKEGAEERGKREMESKRVITCERNREQWGEKGMEKQIKREREK